MVQESIFVGGGLGRRRRLGCLLLGKEILVIFVKCVTKHNGRQREPSIFHAILLVNGGNPLGGERDESLAEWLTGFHSRHVGKHVNQLALLKTVSIRTFRYCHLRFLLTLVE